MPALPPYIPTQGGECTCWLANFSTLISADHEYIVPGRPTA
jgi:hypothetical protein